MGFLMRAILAFVFLTASHLAYAQGISPLSEFGIGGGMQDGVNCTVKPIQTVDLSSQIRGLVAEVMVRPGAHVKKGDPLVGLDVEIAKSEMLLSKTRSESDAMLKAAVIKRDALAKKEARLAKAVAQKAVSLSDYDQAVLELALAENDILRENQSLDIARIDYQKAKLLVEKSVIKSPVDGVIGEELVAPGEAVSDGPLATIFVIDPLLVEAFVPVQLLSKYARQSQYKIRIDGDGPQGVPVQLDHISQMADLTSNTVSMFFTLSDSTVLPGSKCILLPPRS